MGRLATGARLAFESFLQVGKLHLMMREATVPASPLGAGPTVEEQRQFSRRVTATGRSRRFGQPSPTSK